MKERRTELSLLKITIGMPTYNRAQSIPIVLKALGKLDYPKRKVADSLY